MATPIHSRNRPHTLTRQPGRRAAVALRYDPERAGAPQIVAKGKGEIADRILSSAKDNQVPIIRNVGLAGALMSMNLGDEIPPRVYTVVAEVLAFVYSAGSKVEEPLVGSR